MKVLKARRPKSVEVKKEVSPKVNKYQVAQEKEFGKFLEDEMMKSSPFKFLVDMKKKLDDGELLTENMENAIRRCMARNKPKTSDFEAYAIQLKVVPFIMKDLKLDSRLITGKVKRETQKAWLVEGHADMSENVCWCVSCGRQLTEPASQVTGLGRVCAEKVGIPYDPKNILEASTKERKKIRAMYMTKLHAQKFERWIPKSMAEVYEEAL